MPIEGVPREGPLDGGRATGPIAGFEEARAEMNKAEEALVDEVQATPEKGKKIISKYKELVGFQLDLQRSGQVTYEYGYRVALAWFRARYPDLGIEEDPFTSLPEDENVAMPNEVPFDDSVGDPKA